MYLLEDLLEQPLIMKLFIAWGWLSVAIMFLSAGSAGWEMALKAMASPATEVHQSKEP